MNHTVEDCSGSDSEEITRLSFLTFLQSLSWATMNTFIITENSKQIHLFFFPTYCSIGINSEAEKVYLITVVQTQVRVQVISTARIQRH